MALSLPKRCDMSAMITTNFKLPSSKLRTPSKYSNQRSLLLHSLFLTRIISVEETKGAEYAGNLVRTRYVVELSILSSTTIGVAKRRSSV